MKYFINVARGNHEGGTKFYDVWGLIARPDHNWNEAKIVLIQNWGKINSYRVGIHPLTGQHKVNFFNTSSGADNFYKDTKAAKEIRGYEFHDSTIVYESDNSDEFWNKVSELRVSGEHYDKVYRHLFGGPLPAPEIKPQTNTSSTTFKDKSINDPLWGTW